MQGPGPWSPNWESAAELQAPGKDSPTDKARPQSWRAIESRKFPRTRPQKGPEQEPDPQPRPRMEWGTNRQGHWWLQALIGECVSPV